MSTYKENIIWSLNGLLCDRTGVPRNGLREAETTCFVAPSYKNHSMIIGITL